MTELMSPPGGRIPVLVIDLDGCLFHSDRLHGRGGPGLIARSIHRYCERRYGLTAAESDALYGQYGDTIVGLERTGRIASAADVADYYQGVYRRLRVAESASSSSSSTTTTTA